MSQAVSRRQFLKQCGFLGAGLGILCAAPATLARPAQGVKTLSLYNLHTTEKIQAPFWENGHYLRDAIEEISYVLRDHRTGDRKIMDKRLLEYLHNLQNTVGSHRQIEVISGYRSPKTNRMLHSRDNKGVAKKSFHVQGRAIDIRLSDVELKHLRQAAIQLRLGGVGYYPTSNFLHIDTGRVRNWIS